MAQGRIQSLVQQHVSTALDAEIEAMNHSILELQKENKALEITIQQANLMKEMNNTMLDIFGSAMVLLQQRRNANS